MTTVIGIDPSLTGTGVATVDTLDFADRRVQTIKSAGKEDATLAQRRERLREIVSRACGPVAYLSDLLVVIEGPSLGQKPQRGTFDRWGLWWLIVDELRAYGVPVAGVAPSALKQYATGKGNAGKSEVLLAVARRYPDIDVSNDNEADALCLAAMGARHVGRPLEDALPARNIAALNSVKWPGPDVTA